MDCPSPLPLLDPDLVKEAIGKAILKLTVPKTVEELREGVREVLEALSAQKDMIRFETLRAIRELIEAARKWPLVGGYYYAPIQCCVRLQQLRQVIYVLFPTQQLISMASSAVGDFDEELMRCRIPLSTINVLYAIHANLYSEAVK